MKNFLYIFFTSLLFLSLMFAAGCGESANMKMMDRVDNIIETAPDSALTILESVNVGALAPKEEKARYALLKSMAYDKNYIDTISFEVLQPAIDYYLKKGTPDEKLRTLYYQGRIYQNRNEDEEAMKCFIKATELKDLITDTIVLARLYTAKSSIHYGMNQFHSTALSSLSAADLCKKIGREDLQADNLTQAFDAFLNLEDRYHADSVFDILKTIPEIYRNGDAFTHCKILYVSNFLSQKETLRMLDSIKRDDLNNGILLDMALGYVKAGDKVKSKECFQAVPPSYNKSRVKYLYIRSRVEEINEDYEEALNTLREGIEASDSTINEWTKDDRMFVDDKYKLEENLLKEKDSREKTFQSSVLIILILICCLLLFYVRFRETKIKALKNEKEKIKYRLEALLLDRKYLELQDRLKNLNNNFDEIKDENVKIKDLNKKIKEENEKILYDINDVRQNLVKIEDEKIQLNNMIKEKKRIASELRNLLLDKISLINGLIASHISSNDKHKGVYYELLQTIDNEKENFLTYIRETFEALYPKFMNKLKECRFTEIEIDYVCLYAIGLRGKEISNYLQTKSHYNISSAIRYKLGLDKTDTNLGLFIINEIRKEE